MSLSNDDVKTRGLKQLSGRDLFSFAQLFAVLFRGIPNDKPWLLYISMDEDYWMELSMELSLKIPVVACLWSLLSRMKCLSSKWRRRENFKR